MNGRFRRLSAPGASALSIWRLEADPADLADLAGRSLPPPDRPVRLVLGGRDGPLDEGVLWLRDLGPPVRAELHLHGGAGVARALRSLLAARGWIEAPAPEDSDEARFLAARSPLAARLLASARGGVLDRMIEDLAALPPAEARERAADLLAGEGWARLLEEPPEVVLVGPPNAGKSTLFNAWLEEERVTVSPHPGTTRDAVEAGVLVGSGADAFEVRLVDTAGWWPEAAGVDAEAVAMARARAERAWLRIWVLDAAAAPPADLLARLEARPAADPVLLHRADLAAGWRPPPRPGWISGSIHRDGSGLIARLAAAVAAAAGPPPPPGARLPFGPERRARLRRLLGGAGEGD
ncbi:MAG: hypothetical protein D6702_09700 [Planctomycetota bacterium]|nr:MAG: hypothetical protein D6702_09700 [Planctomycetota bacterium]